MSIFRLMLTTFHLILLPFFPAGTVSSYSPATFPLKDVYVQLSYIKSKFNERLEGGGCKV